jgi:hypothetical protein
MPPRPKSAYPVPEDRVEPPPPSPRIAATRRWRARERNGRVLLKIELDEAALTLALIDANLLAINKADDRKALTAATQRVLERFIAGDISQRAEGDRVKVHLLLAMLRKKAGKSNGQRTSL